MVVTVSASGVKVSDQESVPSRESLHAFGYLLSRRCTFWNRDRSEKTNFFLSFSVFVSDSVCVC